MGGKLKGIGPQKAELLGIQRTKARPNGEELKKKGGNPAKQPGDLRRCKKSQ